MGHFDKTICDCCVCPMQCVLEQLVGMQIGIDTTFQNRGGILISVDNFIATLDENGNIIHISVSDICTVSIVGTFDFKLKPIRKNVGGECSCIEDPITNLAKTMIGKETEIAVCDIINPGRISNVGEGIVILLVNIGTGTATFAISSCKIEGIGQFQA